MAKFTLAKTIEARKLNKRTRLPTGEPPVTIPYGAIIENPEQDRDTAYFSYLGELHLCPWGALQDALEKVPPAEPARPAPEPARPEEVQPEAAAARLRWETVASTHGEVRRAKVPGGWLVAAGGGVTFLPDPEHTWSGGSV